MFLQISFVIKKYINIQRFIHNLIYRIGRKTTAAVKQEVKDEFPEASTTVALYKQLSKTNRKVNSHENPHQSSFHK